MHKPIKNQTNNDHRFSVMINIVLMVCECTYGSADFYVVKVKFNLFWVHFMSLLVERIEYEIPGNILHIEWLTNIHENRKKKGIV